MFTPGKSFDPDQKRTLFYFYFFIWCGLHLICKQSRLTIEGPDRGRSAFTPKRIHLEAQNVDEMPGPMRETNSGSFKPDRMCQA